MSESRKPASRSAPVIALAAAGVLFLIGLLLDSYSARSLGSGDGSVFRGSLGSLLMLVAVLVAIVVGVVAAVASGRSR